jgi:glycosyltransferase involved in cell wall biosynthesis
MTSQNFQAPLKITCILPAKNRKDLLPTALRSIREQHPDPALFCTPEILVVDDGSSDGTADLLARDFPEVRILRTEGIGPGPARNAGAGAAKSEILFFLDSDDLWRPDHLKRLAPCFLKGAGFACSRAYNHNRVDGKDFTIPDTDVDLGQNTLARLKKWCDMVPSALAVRKDLFFEAGGFPDLGWGEDWIFFLELSARSDLCFIPEITVERTLHGQSLCADSHISQRILSMLDAVARKLETLPGAGPEDQAHIRFLKTLTSEKGDPWKSIQDFYTAAKEAGRMAP